MASLKHQTDNRGTLFSLAAQALTDNSSTAFNWFEADTFTDAQLSKLFDDLYPDNPEVGS